MTSDYVLDEALKLSKLGWSIIPVGKNKNPLVKWAEFQKRRASEEEIKAWFKQWPDANIGVVTGKISNLLVLDIDAKHGRNSKEFKTSITVCSNTGGGGEHIFFQYPDFEVHNSAGILFGLGVDIRAEGGYIILAPSLHPSGNHYEWKEFCSPYDLEPTEIPDWLKDKLQERSKGGSEKLYQKDPLLVEEGTRNETATSVAGKIISETHKELRSTIGWNKMKEWNSLTPNPLDEEELKTVWRSVCKYNNKTTQKLLEKNKVPPVYKTSFTDENSLYEMIHNKIEDKTSFIRCDSNNNYEFNVDKIISKEREYTPLPSTSILVDKGVVLFPSGISSYTDEKELLLEIRNFIHKYVDISEEFEQIASYYVLLTWIYDKFYELPYLRAMGDYGSGKSRFLKTIGSLCYKPIFTGGATTPSPIFRIIDETGGTLILDEADFAKSDMTSEIVKILNSGYQKGSPVLRAEGKGTFEIKAYRVFGPKVIATRETFSDAALESRFLVEEMGKNVLRADIPRDTRKEFDSEADSIRNKLLKWRFDNYFKDIIKKDIVIPGIHPRLNQIVLPLLSIINDKEAEDNLTKFIIKYNKDLVADRGLSRESDIVYAILKLENDSFGDNLFTVRQISDQVNELIGVDNEDEKIQPRRVGWYLRKKLQLKTVKTRAGFVLSLQQNRDKLNFWKERFGITDAEVRGEHVNIDDVDIDEEVDVTLI